MGFHLSSDRARALLRAVTFTLLPFSASATERVADKAAEFQRMIVLPTDVRQIAYPIDYEVAQPRSATVADPYCAIATETIAFSAEWLGAFPLPPAVGGPLPSSIRRGAAVKDYWDYGRNNPATNLGCGGSIRQAFEVTLDRFARLGVQHVNISQYVFFADGTRPEQGFVEPSMTADDQRFIGAAAAARGMKVHLQMAIAGSRSGSHPANPIPADWAARFLDAYADLLVQQARIAAEAGYEAIQLDYCCLAPFLDWMPHRALFLAKMSSTADRVRAIFPGHLFFGQLTNLSIIDADLMRRVDWLVFDPPLHLYPPTLDHDRLTVAAIKAKLLGIWAGLAGTLPAPIKPFKWRVFAQSHRDFLKSGWIEDGFCVDGCVQRAATTDFSVQALVYQAYFEAITEQKFFPTASVDLEASWYVDVILPQDAFPNISQSWRNKPAEAIAYAWFRQPGPLPERQRAVEYHHAAFDHYFVTAALDEIAQLDSGQFAGWLRTGHAFDVFAAAAPGLGNVCRFFSTAFSPKSSHFYTPFASECTSVKGNADWQHEGNVFGVALPGLDGSCPAATMPVYRLYNDGRAGAPNHRYTIDPGVQASMRSRGWVAEGTGTSGVIMCSPQP